MFLLPAWMLRITERDNQENNRKRLRAVISWRWILLLYLIRTGNSPFSRSLPYKAILSRKWRMNAVQIDRKERDWREREREKKKEKEKSSSETKQQRGSLNCARCSYLHNSMAAIPPQNWKGVFSPSIERPFLSFFFFFVAVCVCARLLKV